MFAPHHKLNNIIPIIDYNKIQSFGSTEEVLNLEPLNRKIESFGWDVIEIDGHDHEEILTALTKASNNLKPAAIIAHTIKGKGVDFMENQLLWHYKSPSEEQYIAALKQLEK